MSDTQNIPADGDLGPLGSDTPAMPIITDEMLAAFKTSTDALHASLVASADTNATAEQHVALLESWVTVGQQALAIAGPLLDAYAKRTTAAAAAPHVSALQSLTGKVAGIAGAISSLSGLFTGIHATGNPPVV